MDHRPRRHRRITDILQHHRVKSQEDLRLLLAEQGFEVAQATLSRDLRELGVRKGPDGYELPAHNGRPTSHAPLQRALAAYATSIAPAASLIVLRTGPGHAQLIAVELDRNPPDGVVGTIAGDDTIFIACASDAARARVLRLLRSLADLHRSHA